MEAILCNLDDFLNLIQDCYRGDKKGLARYLDPINGIDIKTTDDAALETKRKLIEYRDYGIALRCYSVVSGGESIGYFVYFYNSEANAYALVSFGVRMQNRTMSELKRFYSLIKKTISGRFYCQLWSKNIRAIKWLMRCGMVDAGKEYFEQNELTNLVCPQ